MARRSDVARWVLIGVGLLFVVNGVLIASLRMAQSIPQAYGWLAPVFLTLGITGTLTAWLGLRSSRRWPLVILAIVYLPWIIVGLVGDTKQGYWPLVAGEALGLALVLWALAARLRRTA